MSYDPHRFFPGSSSDLTQGWSSTSCIGFRC